MRYTLVIKDEKVENGVYITGYLISDNDNNVVDMSLDKVGYKCFIPYSGKLARVPEMSRYFFFTQLRNNMVDHVVVSSEYCDRFIHDDISSAKAYNLQGFTFEKSY